MGKTKKSGSRGFTIVELVTIIAVIGILAAIGIFSWSGAQNSARKNSFQTNAEQVKLKLGEYFTEHNRYFKDKTSVCIYLEDIQSTALHEEFCTSTNNSGAYEYVASAATLPTVTACLIEDDTPTNTPSCISYMITVEKANWNGSGTDADIIVKP